MQRMAPRGLGPFSKDKQWVLTAVGFVEPSQREELRRTGSPADALLQAGSLGAWRRFQVLLPILLTSLKLVSDLLTSVCEIVSD